MDILELSPSQYVAANFLNMHQSTVSRSVRRIQTELELDGPSELCRHGRNACLDQLRLACRAHRVMKGVLRIGTDVLHQVLLPRKSFLQLVPPQFRRADQWAELVRIGLLDGAIISSWGLEKPLPQGRSPRWSGLEVHPLGVLPLWLMAFGGRANGVLLPSCPTAPLLHMALENDGHRVVSQPRAAQAPAAWLKRMRDRNLALPLCPDLVGSLWLRQQELMPVPDLPPLRETLWLLQPHDLKPADAAMRSLRLIRRCVSRATAS